MKGFTKTPIMHPKVEDSTVARQAKFAQDGVRELSARLADPSRAMLSGQLVEGVKLGVGNTKVKHGLGRVPQGWHVVKGPRAGVDEVDMDANFLTLSSTGAVTVSLWVF
jgi:hypothetical protein